MAVYLARYLNVPPARLPGEAGGRPLDDLPTEAEHSALLCSTPSTASGRSTWRPDWSRATSRSGTRRRPLVATLGRALLREDAGFHAYQMFEAGVRQLAEWGDTAPGRHILLPSGRPYRRPRSHAA